MGDRALAIFVGVFPGVRGNDVDVSPTFYTHWGGRRVPEFIETVKQLMLAGKDDPDTNNAGGACALMAWASQAYERPENYSMRCWNTPLHIQNIIGRMFNDSLSKEDVESLYEYSHGDRGIFIVNVSDFTIQIFDGEEDDASQ